MIEPQEKYYPLKYYPFKDVKSFEFASRYYTYDIMIYLTSVRLRRYSKLNTILSLLSVLSLLGTIVFATLRNLPFTISFLVISIVILFIICIFDFYIDNAWYTLYEQFKDTNEVQEQLELEQYLAESTIKDQSLLLAQDIVELYNILDNKKLSKKTKIEKITKYIKEIKENK